MEPWRPPPAISAHMQLRPDNVAGGAAAGGGGYARPFSAYLARAPRMQPSWKEGVGIGNVRGIECNAYFLQASRHITAIDGVEDFRAAPNMVAAHKDLRDRRYAEAPSHRSANVAAPSVLLIGR
jgi:hypothetical protein